MKVTVEYNDPYEARIALQSLAYVEFIEEFEKYLVVQPGAVSRPEIYDKFCSLKDLYKI